MCSTRCGLDFVDDGTTCRQRSPLPGPTGQPRSLQDLYEYSPAVKVVADATFSIAPHMTWDAFWRLIYDRANEALQRQANLLLRRGNLAFHEADALVNARNQLLLRIRARLSPFGELYSEILKPRASLKTLEQFVQQKGSIEAVLKSVGNTRQVVDKIGVVSRVAGPAAIAIEISLTAIVIQLADPEDQARVAAREIGGATGSVAFGMAGAWAGCAGFAAIASPSLVLPLVGEVSTGGACLIGGILGGIGIGFVGRKAGEAAGEAAYHLYNEVSEFTWVPPVMP
jgi:hypothetical protein